MRTTQIRPPERTERYLAVPCTGNSGIENDVYHLFKVLDYEHPSGKITFRGWLTRDAIEQRFGDSVYFGDTYRSCPDCRRAFH
jgi:hypothetical protein